MTVDRYFHCAVRPSWEQQPSSSSPLGSRVSTLSPHAKSSLLQKVGKVAGKGLQLVAAFVAIFTLFPVVAAIYSYFKNQGIKERIEEAQIEKLASALKLGLAGHSKMQSNSPFSIETYYAKQFYSPNDSQDRKDYFDELFKIRDDLIALEQKRKKGGITVGSVQRLYQRVQELFGQTPGSKFARVYQTLMKEEPENEAVTFLRYFAVKYRMADMSQVIADHAESRLDKGTVEKYSIDEINKANKEEFKSHWAFKRDTLFQKIVWGFTHPLATLHSIVSEFSPKSYNSHESNPTFVVQKGEYRNVPFQVIAGPTPINDKAYQEGVLRVVQEIRFNNMDMHKKNERVFIEDFSKVIENSENVDYALLGFDAKFKSDPMKKLLSESTTSPALIEGYEKFLLAAKSSKNSTKDYGIFTTASEAQIKTACQASQELFQRLLKEKTIQGDEALMRAIILGTDTLLELGIITERLQAMQNESNLIDPDLRAAHICVACKQCYDRGPVYLAMLMLFLRSLTNKELLSKKEFYTISGLFFARAPLGEGRNALMHRYVVYDRLADLFQGEKGLKILGEQTQKYYNKKLSSPDEFTAAIP